MSKRNTCLILALVALLAACLPAGGPSKEGLSLTILYTNDEHGWMEGMEPGQGAAELLGLWQQEHGYSPDGPFLVLSGGDNWTGPAISTWFDGQSMVEVMNAMGYHASAVGNHEFDFGLDGLQARLGEADYPYLAANVRSRETGTVPTGLGIQPFAIVEVAGVKVGLIGLSATYTARVTNPDTVAGFDFIDYDLALEEVVPAVEEAGADLIVVPAHICLNELLPLARQAGDLGVDLIGGGHCNELAARQVGEVVVLAGGYHFTSYAYATFHLDPQTREVLTVDYAVRQNQGGQPEEAVASVVARWRDEADAELEQPIGYLEREIGRRSPEMAALITESWLWSYPNADVAATNWGGMRDRIPAGEVTLSSIVSVMPFNNVLVEVQLTGDQLTRLLAGNLAVGGAHRAVGGWRLDQTGEPPDPQATYSVLVNDFMYAGGDDFSMLAEYDPQGYNTAIDWRQPVIDWILDQESSPRNPLDEAIGRLK